ncbi:hypothetical protein PHISP_02280 [Aspergillus sp. HF37]|nr:hypothetical protein PHISP_02280 [Aspergillus sp. HF37]
MRTRLDIPPPFPVTKTCPEFSCSCPTPAMPEGSPIDYEQPLNGTMAAYAQQMVICTGQRDWASRIENDGENTGWGELVRGLSGCWGVGGGMRMSVDRVSGNPFNNILMSASSFAASEKASSPAVASALLFPSFKYFPSIPVDASPDTDLSTFLRAFLLPEKLNNMYSSLPESKRAELTRAPNLASNFPDAIDLQHSPTILICGHGGRDVRCGIMAPVLEDEFRHVLRARGFASAGDGSTAVGPDRPDQANVGLISHVGGHKYAGNVIVYIPPGMVSNPLAGMGIWYGLVEPKHVQGIVEETVLGGRVVVDHFRGGIRRDGEILRL